MWRKKENETEEIEESSELETKDGEKENIEGLTAIIKINEEINVEQNHEANIKNLDFKGNLSIENPSNIDRIWDIEANFKNTEGTDLDSNEFQIKELGIEEENNAEVREFNLSEEVKNLLIVKEYINTLPNADDILNFNDIETDLINLRDKIQFIEGEEITSEPLDEAEAEAETELDESVEEPESDRENTSDMENESKSKVVQELESEVEEPAEAETEAETELDESVEEPESDKEDTSGVEDESESKVVQELESEVEKPAEAKNEAETELDKSVEEPESDREDISEAELESEPEVIQEAELEVEDISEAEDETITSPEPTEEDDSEEDSNLKGWFQKLVDEEEDKLEEDGGVDIEEYSLESYGITLNTVNKVNFAIGMRNLFQKEVVNLTISKEIPAGLENIEIGDKTHGMVELKGNQLIWKIDSLASETNAILKFTAEVLIDSLEPVKTGTIKVDYTATSSFSGGIELEDFKATTRNRYQMDIIEQDDAPGVWDCSFAYKNNSEFKIEILDIDIHTPEEPDISFIKLDSENLPRVGANQEWQSDPWTYTSDNYPVFRRNIDFRVLPEFIAEVSGVLSIEDIELILASITGEVSYEVAEPVIGVEEESNVVKINSYTISDIEATLTMINNGSAPLNEVSFDIGNFTENFQAPSLEEIKLQWDGEEIEVPLESISIEEVAPGVLLISLKNLKESPTGMFNPDSKIDITFPIHAVNPERDSVFESNIIMRGNTFPLGQPVEYIPPAEEIPLIKVVHIRRKFRKGKQIIPIGAIGNYQIILVFENVGNVALRNVEILDKVLDTFTYKDFSLEPEKIIDEKEVDILSWKFDSIKPEEKIEIIYNIQGEGEYSPKDTQLAL